MLDALTNAKLRFEVQLVRLNSMNRVIVLKLLDGSVIDLQKSGRERDGWQFGRWA
jgi:hypothetical protein